MGLKSPPKLQMLATCLPGKTGVIGRLDLPDKAEHKSEREQNITTITNKNLAITNSFSTLRAFIGLNITP